MTFDTIAPTVSQPATAFELTATSGKRVALASATARGPVVLVFASFTCPPSRMKLPRFEALAQRWQDRAQVLVLYAREAHPHAKNSERLNGFADQVQARDGNGGGTVTVAEYGDLGPRYMLDDFDLDHDGEVRSHELLAARRLDQFKEIEAPKTLADRAVLANRLRAEVPGRVPILVDGMDDAVANAYGGWPNMAYVIAQGGKVASKMPWAAVADIDAGRRRPRVAARVPREARAVVDRRCFPAAAEIFASRVASPPGPAPQQGCETSTTWSRGPTRSNRADDVRCMTEHGAAASGGGGNCRVRRATSEARDADSRRRAARRFARESARVRSLASSRSGGDEGQAR